MRLDASEAQLTSREPNAAVMYDRVGPAARARMDPLERLAALCDPGTLRRVEITDARARSASSRPSAGSARTRGLLRAGLPAGGWIGRDRGGGLVVRVLRMARSERMPVVGFLESAGARLQEGAAALGGFGRIFYENVSLNGTAPQISVITGTAAGGGCYSPALTDFTVMTRPATMFLTGPKVVQEAVGEEISASALGGPRGPRAQRRLPLRGPGRPPRGRGGPRARRLPRTARGAPAARGTGPAIPATAAIRGVTCPPRRARSTTCATCCATSSTTAASSRSRHAGRAT